MLAQRQTRCAKTVCVTRYNNQIRSAPACLSRSRAPWPKYTSAVAVLLLQSTTVLLKNTAALHFPVPLSGHARGSKPFPFCSRSLSSSMGGTIGHRRNAQMPASPTAHPFSGDSFLRRKWANEAEVNTGTLSFPCPLNICWFYNT